MGEITNIAWTDHTFNPWIGCDKVSAGCKHCYASVDAPARIARSQGIELWGRDASRKITSNGNWQKPRAWDRAAKASGKRALVFCASQADVFEDRRDLDAPRARLWALICETPHLTWLLLTKRPEHADRLWASAGNAALANVGSVGLRTDAGSWHPNVWLGTTCEDQQRADERIPHLLRVPAAVRFLSCEPLLGPVDLKGWGAAAPSRDLSDAPETWEAFAWPDFVPADVRRSIETFWSPANGCGRGPKSWLQDHLTQGVPATGSVVPFALGDGRWAEVSKMPLATRRGRYVHRWNNIGCIIADDGESFACSSHSGSGWMSKWLTTQGDYRAKIDWVIGGGESGHGARPCDVAWLRSLRDQCAAAGIPYFNKQLGARPVVEGLGNLGIKDPKGGNPDEWAEDLRVREWPKAGA